MDPQENSSPDQSQPDGGEFLAPTDQAGPDSAAAAPASGDFLPSSGGGDPHGGAVMGGPASQHYLTQTPINQDDSQVTPEEQKQYDDFVTRSLLFINDPRVPKNGNGNTRSDAKAPRDVIIDHLNAVGGMSSAEAIGRTTAQVASLIANNAQYHGQPYTADVIFHGADEIISNLYDVGVASGVIKNAPPSGSEAEQKLLATAKMYAAKYYGDNMIASGQLTPQMRQQNYQYAQQQIQKEGESGMLDNWHPQVSNPAMLETIRRMSVGQPLVQQTPRATSIADHVALGHPRLVPPGGAPPQPAPQQAAPQAMPPQGGQPNG